MAGLTFKNVYKRYGKTAAQQVFDADTTAGLGANQGQDVDATIRRVASSQNIVYAVNNFSLECADGESASSAPPAAARRPASGWWRGLRRLRKARSSSATAS